MQTARLITRDEVRTLLNQQHGISLIDVLPAESYEEAHLPGAKNACVYEVGFVDQVRKLVPDPAATVILYGSSARNLASATAAEKLIRAGYVAVHDYRGGFADWSSAGQPVEGRRESAKQTERPVDGRYEIDPRRSKIEWTGRNLTGSHTGTMKLLEGTIEVENGSARRASFIIDMTSIENHDIADGGMRQVLVDHLKSDDFFDVERFPTADFKRLHIRVLSGAIAGSPNCKVAGELTLKGVCRPVEFEAIISRTPEGFLAAEAHFDIDRTQWNILYGSGKFYEKLGKHLVHDHVSIGVRLLTR